MRGQLALLLEEHGSNEQLAAAMSGMDVCSSDRTGMSRGSRRPRRHPDCPTRWMSSTAHGPPSCDSVWPRMRQIS
jgi:hypothetical protein